MTDDAVTPDGKVFLVMELLEGASLAARMRRLASPLPPREVLAISERILDVLAHAHERGIVHRDIKPDNVFVTAGGDLKVLDFGIARLRDLVDLGADVTFSGSLLGTPAFMAPEQARSTLGEVDARTDLWAVGATMFTLLTGRHVHEGPSAHDVLIAAGTQSARSLGVVLPDLDPPLVGIVDRALRFDREERWVDARKMQAAVKELTGGQNGSLAEICSECITMGAQEVPCTPTPSETSMDSVAVKKTPQPRPLRGAALGAMALAALIASAGWVGYVGFARPLEIPPARAVGATPRSDRWEFARVEPPVAMVAPASTETPAAAPTQSPSVRSNTALARPHKQNAAPDVRARHDDESALGCDGPCAKPSPAQVDGGGPGGRRLLPWDPILDRRD